MKVSALAVSSRHDLLQEMRRRWESGAMLVVPGGQAREHWLREMGAFVGEDRLLTLPGFWGTLAGRAQGSFPGELRAAESRIIIEKEGNAFPALHPLLHSPGGAETIRRSLERKKMWNLPFAVDPDLQKTLGALEEALASKGALPGQRRWLLAKAAESVRFDRPIVFVHPPETHPLFRSLASSLAKNNDVVLLFLGGEALQENLADIELETTGEIEAPSARWIRTEDPEIFAAGEALRLLGEGVLASEIAIVDFSASRSFARKAEEAGLALFLRRSVKAEDLRLGAALLQNRNFPPFVFSGSLPGSATEALEEGERMLQDAFAKIGDRERMESSALLRSFRLLLQNAEERGIELKKEEALKGLATERLPLGQRGGVRLLSPGEMPATFFSHTILFGLGAEDFPLPTERDPLLGRVPRTSQEAIWQAALLASENGTFLCAEGDPGSPFWQRDSKEEKRVHSPVWDRKEALLLAEEGKWPGLAEKIQRSKIQGDKNFRSSFSVSELEQYLQCPYGWFVRYKLRPETPESMAQTVGNFYHDLLAELWQYPEEERESVFPDLFDERSASLSKLDKELFLPRLQRVLEKYSGSAWPFRESYAEKDLAFSVPDSEGNVRKIYGRADRIDVWGEGEERRLLVIDYKSRRAAGDKNTQLQPFLYPLMAAEEMAASPAGFIYVSIATSESEGYLAYPMDAFPHLSTDWRFRSQRALQAAKRAIDGIESGDWSSVSDSCPPWCAHRLLGGGS